MYKNRISVGNYSQLSNTRFLKNGTQLIVETDIHIDGDMISHNSHLEVIPILSSTEVRLELPFVLVNGKKRHRAYKKMCAHLGKCAMEKSYRIYKEIIASRNLHCRYRQEIPYEEWMDDAILQVREG